MTKVYFVRHAKPDYEIHDDLIRPLTQEGMQASKKVTQFLMQRDIDKAFSSPYKRSVDTIKDFAEKAKLHIEIIEDFRERKIDDEWIEDFNAFAKKQWEDFEYKLRSGENLKEVQERNIAALEKVVKENRGKNIIVGSHGTAIGTILNHYDSSFDYSGFERIKGLMPFIVCFTFDEIEVIKIEEFLIE